MIIQDKTPYKKYIKETTEKVQKLMDSVASVAIPANVKQDINKKYISLSAKISLLDIKSENKKIIISKTDWDKSKQEIESLYTELFNMVNDAIALVNTRDNVR